MSQFLIFSLLMMSTMSFASTKPTYKEFKTGEDTVKTFVPEGWDGITNLFGIPLTLVSKKGIQDRRTVVSIIPGEKDFLSKMEKLGKDPDEYYAQTEDWLEGIEGESLTYEPFKETKIDGALIYSVGMKYAHGGGEFLDQTYFISAKSKQFYMVKATTPLDLETDQAAQLQQVIDTLSAQN